MKICFLANTRTVHVARLVTGLAQRGHEVHVVTHKPADIPGATVERFAVPPPGLTNPRRNVASHHSIFSQKRPGPIGWGVSFCGSGAAAQAYCPT